jgi:imidazolonepropionase-like amidohydrolase
VSALATGITPGAPEFSEDEIRAAVEEAALVGTHVAAHAHGAEGIKRAIRAGVRSIEHGSLMDDEAIELMVSHGTYLVADIYCGDWIAEEGARGGWSPDVIRKNEETTDAQREGFTKAVKAGVSIAYGTTAACPPRDGGQTAGLHGRRPDADGGVRSATVVASELMGW